MVLLLLKFINNFRFDKLESLSEDNNVFKFIKQYDRLIGLYLYECEELYNIKEKCLDDADKLRLGILPNIILLFFTMLGYRYLNMMNIYKENLGSKTQKYLHRMMSKNEYQIDGNQFKSDEIEPKNIDLSISSILNEREDNQKIDISDADNERLYINNIRWIVMNHIDVNICDEM